MEVFERQVIFKSIKLVY